MISALENKVANYDPRFSVLKRSTSRPNSQEGPMYPNSGSSAGVRVATPAAPPQAGPDTLQRVSSINDLANAVERVKAQISDLNKKLVGTDPQSPAHTELVNSIRSLWMDLSGMHAHFVSLTAIS